MGGVPPILELDGVGDAVAVVAEDADEVEGPALASELSNARGALGGALPDIDGHDERGRADEGRRRWWSGQSRWSRGYAAAVVVNDCAVSSEFRLKTLKTSEFSGLSFARNHRKEDRGPKLEHTPATSHHHLA